MVVGLLVAAALAYAGDWAVLRVRVARGAGFDTVEVSRFMVTPLKSGKAEYDFLDRGDVQCTRSMFPQMGDDPCWWVRQHSSVWVLN
jgi:hypothetical protein